MKKTAGVACRASNFVTNIFDWLANIVVLLIRIFLAKIFLWSAWLKLQSWTSTVYMFQNEFSTPFPPEVAAVLCTACEIIFPLFLLIGLGGRIPALGLFIFNIVSVYFYPILFTPEYASALKDHIMWGILIAIPLFYGHGIFSLDYLLQRKVCKQYRY